MKPLRVALCDDVEVVRVAFESFLSTDPSIEVVGSFACGIDLLAALRSTPTDVVLLDVRMPGMDGPEVARCMHDANVTTKVVYLTSYPDEIPIADALSGRVVGALSKDLPPDDLVRAVHLAARGVSTIAAPVLRSLTDTRRSPEWRRDDFARDERELSVLRLLCKGYTNDQIARSLNRSASSVKQILSAMCRRAGVSGRTELVLYLLDDASLTNPSVQ